MSESQSANLRGRQFDPRECAYKITGTRPHLWSKWRPESRSPGGCKTYSFSARCGNMHGGLVCFSAAWPVVTDPKGNSEGFWGIFIKIFVKKKKKYDDIFTNIYILKKVLKNETTMSSWKSHWFSYFFLQSALFLNSCFYLSLSPGVSSFSLSRSPVLLAM